MIVFIAGMQRSGSTFCFNVTREILAQSGSLYCAPTGDLAIGQTAARGVNHLLLKAHSATPALIEGVREGHIKSIVSIRPIEDAIASCMDIWGMSLDVAIAHLKIWHQMYREISDSSLTIAYESIDTHPDDVVRTIARYLSQDADLTEIAARYSKAAVAAAVKDMRRDQAGVRDVGFSYYDMQTFFHRRHVISLLRRDVNEFLSASDLARIRDEFGGRADEPHD